MARVDGVLIGRAAADRDSLAVALQRGIAQAIQAAGLANWSRQKHAPAALCIISRRVQSNATEHSQPPTVNRLSGLSAFGSIGIKSIGRASVIAYVALFVTLPGNSVMK